MSQGCLRCFCAGLLVCASAAHAKDKKVKSAAEPHPKTKLRWSATSRWLAGRLRGFQSTQHYSSYYLYAEHDAGKNVTLIDVTKVGNPPS